MLLIGGIISGSILYAGIKSRTKYKKVHDKEAAIIKNRTLLSQEKLQIKDQLTVISKREDNKDLSIATVSLGLVLAGNFIFPPLSIFGIAGLTYLVWPIWKRAYYDITQKKRFTRMVLKSLILPSTLLAGQFLAAALAYWFLYLALHIVSKAKTNTTKNLNSIFEAPADQIVYVLRQHIEVEITLKEVQLGDILVIASGETIPIDGTIIKGYASIDQHMLT